MGERGPKPKLPELARLDGNPGNRPVVDSGIVADGAPETPLYLPHEAKLMQERIVSSMPPAVYAKLDSAMLSAFASAWYLHSLAMAEIASYGFEPVYQDDNGVERTSEWIKIANSQATIMATIGDRLGLNPKARAALVNKPAEKRNKFETDPAGRTKDAPPVISPGSSNSLSLADVAPAGRSH